MTFTEKLKNLSEDAAILVFIAFCIAMIGLFIFSLILTASLGLVWHWPLIWVVLPGLFIYWVVNNFGETDEE